MAHHAAAERRRARHLVAVERPLAHRLLDLRRQRRTDPLVGVDREHPIALRQRQRLVELAPKTFEGMKADAGSPALGDPHGVVVAAGIDHDALVAERDAVETLRNVHRFVLGDDDCAQDRHLAHANCQRFDFAPVTAGSRTEFAAER